MSTKATTARVTETVDERLRRYGWEIHLRPEDGPTIWIRNKIQRTQLEALKISRVELERVGNTGKKVTR